MTRIKSASTARAATVTFTPKGGGEPITNKIGKIVFARGGVVANCIDCNQSYMDTLINTKVNVKNELTTAAPDEKDSFPTWIVFVLVGVIALTCCIVGYCIYRQQRISEGADDESSPYWVPKPGAPVRIPGASMARPL